MQKFPNEMMPFGFCSPAGWFLSATGDTQSGTHHFLTECKIYQNDDRAKASPAAGRMSGASGCGSGADAASLSTCPSLYTLYLCRILGVDEWMFLL